MATQTGDAGGSDGARTTAIAAGVAVPVGVLALALGAFLMYRAKRKGTSAEHAEGGGGGDGGKGKSYETDGAAVGELVSDPIAARVPPWEIDSNPVKGPVKADPWEIDENPEGGPVEKDGVAVVSELDANVRR